MSLLLDSPPPPLPRARRDPARLGPIHAHLRWAREHYRLHPVFELQLGLVASAPSAASRDSAASSTAKRRTLTLPLPTLRHWSPLLRFPILTAFLVGRPVAPMLDVVSRSMSWMDTVFASNVSVERDPADRRRLWRRRFDRLVTEGYINAWTVGPRPRSNRHAARYAFTTDRGRRDLIAFLDDDHRLTSHLAVLVQLQCLPALERYLGRRLPLPDLYFGPDSSQVAVGKPLSISRSALAGNLHADVVAAFAGLERRVGVLAGSGSVVDASN